MDNRRKQEGTNVDNIAMPGEDRITDVQDTGKNPGKDNFNDIYISQQQAFDVRKISNLYVFSEENKYREIMNRNNFFYTGTYFELKHIHIFNSIHVIADKVSGIHTQGSMQDVLDNYR